MIRNQNLVIISGPEGCGTSYLYNALVRGNPDLPNSYSWCHAIFNQQQSVPSSGIHHISIPSKRPARWLDEVDLPSHAKLVFCIRDKEKAAESARRRFANSRNHSQEEQLSYDRAMGIVRCLATKYATLLVQYKSLGNIDVRNGIQAFASLNSGVWDEFRYRGG